MLHLIKLPFQKKQYTYLPQNTLRGGLTIHNLPVAYHRLVTQQNGGYTSNSYFPTTHPTLDALDAVFIPYFAGIFVQNAHLSWGEVPSLLYQEKFKNYSALSDCHLIFYEDEDRVVYFDYSHTILDNQPRIMYYELSTGRNFLLAPDFETLLSIGEQRYFSLPAPSLKSIYRMNHACLNITTGEEFLHLLQNSYPNPKEDWWKQWLNYFQQHNNIELRRIASRYQTTLSHCSNNE